MRLTLDALQILDAIDTQGSFAAAAERLHRVPSALSHAVQKLEGDMGVTLFEKSGRRAVLTPAGRTLLEDGRHLLRAALELEARVRQVATGWETELAIAVDAIIPMDRILPLLQRYYAEGHGTRLRLSYEVLGGCWDALATGRADLMIGAPGDMPARSGIATRPLATLHSVFTVAPHHPLAAVPEPIAVSEQIRHRAVVLADTSQELAARTSGLLEGQDALRVPDIESKAAAQAAGLGVGHLPPWLAQREVAAGRLVVRRLAAPKPPTPLYLAWRTGHEGRALAWFLQALEDPALCQQLTEGLR
jgi:DNA-binding transcriptional LysR family regulator